MNLEKIFNFIKEKKGYDVPKRFVIINKINNNVPLSEISEIFDIDYDGDLDLSGLPIKDLGNLKSVGGSLNLRSTPIKSLGNLKSVEGGLNLFKTQIKSLGNLESVGGNLVLYRTPLLKKYSEEEIRQMVDVKGDIYM